MKKLLSVLLVLFVLCGCGGSKLYYKVTDQPLIQNLDKQKPESIDVYSDDKFGSAFIEDSEQINKIVELLKKIEVGEEVDSIPDNGLYLTLNFGYECDIVEIHGEIISLHKNGFGVYHKATNTKELIEYCNSLIDYPVDPFIDNYTEVYSKDGITFLQGLPLTELDGNVSVEIEVENNSDKAIEIVVNPTVNDIAFHGYQRFGVDANSQVGYICTIPSSGLYEFGISKIGGNLVYTIDVYEQDYETHETLGHLFTTDKIVAKLSDDYDSNITKQNIIYSKNGLDICASFLPSIINTNLILYFESTNDLDEINVLSVTLNGEVQEGYEGYFDIVVDENKKMALIPIYNFTYDEASQQTTTFGIQTLVLNTEINGVDTKIGVVKK